MNVALRPVGGRLRRLVRRKIGEASNDPVLEWLASHVASPRSENCPENFFPPTFRRSFDDLLNYTGNDPPAVSRETKKHASERERNRREDSSVFDFCKFCLKLFNVI